MRARVRACVCYLRTLFLSATLMKMIWCRDTTPSPLTGPALLCCYSGARRWVYPTPAVLAAAPCHRTMDGLSRECKKLFPSSVPRRPGGSKRTGRHLNRLWFSPSSRFIRASVTTNGLRRFMWIVFFFVTSTFHAAFHCGETTCQKAAHWHVFGSQDQRCATRRQIRQLPPDKLTSQNGDAEYNENVTGRREVISASSRRSSLRVSYSSSTWEIKWQKTNTTPRIVRRPNNICVEQDVNMYALWMFSVSPLRYVRLCLHREAILNCMK